MITISKYYQKLIFKGENSKKAIRILIIFVLPMILSSCIFLVSGQLKIDRAEYEDATHFLLYFSGKDSECFLPDEDSIFVSNKHAYSTERTHNVVSIERDWWDIFMGGYLYRCEVNPPFEAGEKVYVYTDVHSQYSEIGGVGEFTVPKKL